MVFAGEPGALWPALMVLFFPVTIVVIWMVGFVFYRLVTATDYRPLSPKKAKRFMAGVYLATVIGLAFSQPIGRAINYPFYLQFASDYSKGEPLREVERVGLYTFDVVIPVEGGVFLADNGNSFRSLQGIHVARDGTLRDAYMNDSGDVHVSRN